MHTNLVDPKRTALVDRLRKRLMLSNHSEVIRRLIDAEAQRQGISPDELLDAATGGTVPEIRLQTIAELGAVPGSG